MRSRPVALALLLGLFAATPAFAGHHLWDFTEAFTSADGSVQFVELFTADNNEQNLGGFTVTRGTNSVTLVNLPTAITANTYLLFATSGFGSLPGGVPPDYVIPANFLAIGGGTLNYASGADIWNYGALPTNGTSSLYRNGSTAANTPENFAHQQGSVSILATPGFPRWGLILLVGSMLLAASGLLRRRQPQLA